MTTPQDSLTNPMTHPITPPAELVELWITEVWHEGTPVQVAASDLHIATQAARWGADQELEACCDFLELEQRTDYAALLRAARRPKPPSLKQQALDALDSFEGFTGSLEEVDIIRRALESLPDPQD